MKEDNWENRSANMRCKTCIYFVPKFPFPPEEQAPYHVGRCRRNAPTMKGWPVLYVNDWCGEHKLDENKIQPPEPHVIKVSDAQRKIIEKQVQDLKDGKM